MDPILDVSWSEKGGLLGLEENLAYKELLAS